MGGAEIPSSRYVNGMHACIIMNKIIGLYFAQKHLNGPTWVDIRVPNKNIDSM